MLLMLIILIICTLFLYYILLNRDFLSPTFIIFAMFILCSFFALLGNESWGVDISLITYIAIFSGLFSFTFGEVFVDIAFHGGKVSRCFRQCPDGNRYYKFPRIVILIVLIVGIFVFYMYFRKMNAIASSFGYSGGLSFMALSYAKAGLLDGAVLGKVLSTSVNLVYGIGFNCIFALCYNVLVCNRKTKRECCLLLPVIPQLLCYAVSGSRNGFITITVFTFFCFFLLYYKTHDIKNKKSIGIKKVIVIIAVVFFAFFELFQFLGVFLGKTGVRTPLEMLYIYAGSSIPALSKYLSGGVVKSASIGNESFVGIANWFYRLFGTVEGLKNFEHIRFANTSTTNIYTCFREYIDDFGYIGSCFIMFVLGFVHKYYYEKIKRRKNAGLLVILYSYFMYYHVSSIFAASTTIYLFSNTQLSQMIWIVGIYFVFNNFFLRKVNNEKIFI